jgi:hypothetical protein
VVAIRFGLVWFGLLVTHVTLETSVTVYSLQFTYYDTAYNIWTSTQYNSGPGSSVGIATDYGLGSPGIESRWGARFSAPVQTVPGAHPASCTVGTGSFPGVKCGRGLLLTTHPLLVPRSWKSRAIPLPTLWATPGL